MRLWFPRERYALDVVPRLLLASTELILDALPPLQPNTLFLDLQAGAGPLARPLADRIAGLGRLVAVDLDEALAANLPCVSGRAARAVAAPGSLPFADAVFDGVFLSLALSAADLPVVAETRRVLRPGGWLLATVFLRGSFDALLEGLTRACGEAGHDAHRAALAAAQEELWDEVAWRRAFQASGLPATHLGVEERALLFSSAEACALDPLVTDVLLPSWLGDLPPLPRDVISRGLSSLPRVAGPRVGVRLRTAVVTARSASDPRAEDGITGDAWR